MNTFISLRGIRHAFGEVPVLKGIDLDIPAGSYTTLLGSSGSGKTTLLRVMAGFINPQSGAFIIEAEDMTRMVPRERNIGMVFQNYALFPHLSARQNVEYPLRLRGIARKERERLADEWLDRVHLSAQRHSYPREMSGGQQQRTALARSLVYSPAVLLLDEPLAALDKQLRTQLQSLLKELQRDLAMTFIHVTHDQEEAYSLSSQIVLMREGAIEQVGAPEKLYRYPGTHFAATFIGNNILIPCVVAERQADFVRVRTADGQMLDVARANIAPTVGDSGEVSLCLRKNDGSLATDGNDDASFVIGGRVTECIFQGAQYEVVAETPAGRIAIYSPAAFSPGDTLQAAWPLRECRLVIGSAK